MKNAFYGVILTLTGPYQQIVTDDSERPRRSNGSYTSEYGPEDFLAAIDELEETTTTNIAEHVGCGVGTAHRYLNDLDSDDAVNREEKYGAVIWQKR